MTFSPYECFCENLWQQWLLRELKFPEFPFQAGHMPEPYLRWKDGKDPLYVLTTNPGGGMEHQLRENILAGNSNIKPTASYAESAVDLARFYDKELDGSNAGRRIKSMLLLALACGKDDVFQVESSPYHSANLPQKEKLINLALHDENLSPYIEKLRNFLHDKDVVAVSAWGGQVNSETNIPQLSPWLLWQAELMGLRPQDAIPYSIVNNGKRDTGILLVDSSNGSLKSMYLVVGSNNFPSRKGLKMIADILIKEGMRKAV